VLKIRTIRSGYWVAAASLALVAVATMSVVGSEAADVLAALNEQREVMRLAAISDVFAFLLGVVIVGGEQSHGTITQTFLVEPVRERVLVAKAIVATALGALLALAAVAIVIAIASPWLSAKGIDLELGDGRLQRIILGTVLAAAVAAPLGVGWGAIFRRQGAAIAAALVYLLIGENILQPLLGDNREYSPASAFAAVVNAAEETGPDEGLLAMWPGLLLSVVYTAAFLLAGIGTLGRRDV
jgi:ABC-type transport system involved in multi-copper enzyme maturation permease subunit